MIDLVEEYYEMREFYGGIFSFLKLDKFNLIIMFQRSKKETVEEQKEWGGAVDSMRTHMDSLKVKLKKKINKIMDKGTESNKEFESTV